MTRLIFSMELFRYAFGTIFSLGKMWVYLRFSMRFVEPATVVSVAYIDPGNWGSNLAADSQFGFLFCEWCGSAAGVFSVSIWASGAGLLDL